MQICELNIVCPEFKIVSSTSNTSYRFSAQEVLEMCVQNSNEAGSDVDSRHEGMSSDEESDLDRELEENDESEDEK
jgi:hypothetical protein